MFMKFASLLGERTMSVYANVWEGVCVCNYLTNTPQKGMLLLLLLKSFSHMR